MPADVGFWGALTCLMGRHIRSRHKAKSTPEGWVSRCSRCGVKMVRAHSGGKWIVVKGAVAKQPDLTGEEVLSDAMITALSRSRQSGRRREERSAVAAAKAAARAAKRQERAAAKAIAAASPRQGVLRRKAPPVTGFAAIATAAHYAEAKPKRSLFKRRVNANDAFIDDENASAES